MGTSSYIVEGKGNAESYMSCAHGAGRLMSRKAANTRFRLEDVRKAMAGIVWDAAPAGKKRKKIDLSEAPHAYKNIDSVIALQSDLIEITHRLSPLGVMKG
jgi:tRNA-splicing ligase RtcB